MIAAVSPAATLPVTVGSSSERVACYHPERVAMPVVLEPANRPEDPECPECGERLAYVETDPSASGAFRTQAESMPKMAIHFYDCPSCGTCWKLGARLLPDPVRQILRG